MRPDEEVAAPAGERGTAIGIRLFSAQGIELGIVVQTELDCGIRHGMAVGILHPNAQLADGCIVLRDVDFRVAGIAGDHLLGPIIVTEDLRMHEHTTRGRLIEPPLVEDRLRLTGSQEVPLPIDPRLDPRMIVVGMGPTGGIYLPGRNAHGTQGCHTESALLATATRARAQGDERRLSAPVGGLIGGMLVAPMVHLEHRIIHRQLAHALAQYIIYIGACRVEILVVHTYRQDEVAPLALGHRRAPRHLAPGTQRNLHILMPEGARIVHTVGQRHVAVEKRQILFFLLRATARQQHRKDKEKERTLHFWMEALGGLGGLWRLGGLGGLGVL